MLKRKQNDDQDAYVVAKSSKIAQRTLDEIPDACISIIFSFLGFLDNFDILRLVNHRWRRLAQLPMSFAPNYDLSTVCFSKRVLLTAHMPKGYRPSRIVLASMPSAGLMRFQVDSSRATEIDMDDASIYHRSTMTSILQQARALKRIKGTFLQPPQFMALWDVITKDSCPWTLEAFDFGRQTILPCSEFEIRHLHDLFSCRPMASLTTFIMSAIPIPHSAIALLTSNCKALTRVEISMRSVQKDSLSLLFGGLPHLAHFALIKEPQRIDEDEIKATTIEEMIFALSPTQTRNLESCAFTSLSSDKAISSHALVHLTSGGKLDTIELRNILQSDKGKAGTDTFACRGLKRLVSLGQNSSPVKQLLEDFPGLGNTLEELTFGHKMPDDMMASWITHLCRHFCHVSDLRILYNPCDDDIARVCASMPRLKVLVLSNHMERHANRLTVACFQHLIRLAHIERIDLPINHLSLTSEFGMFAKQALARKIVITLTK